jgi:hypothetical protein
MSLSLIRDRRNEMLTLAIWVSVSVSIDGVDSIGYRVSTKRRYRSNPNLNKNIFRFSTEAISDAWSVQHIRNESEPTSSNANSATHG